MRWFPHSVIGAIVCTSLLAACSSDHSPTGPSIPTFAAASSQVAVVTNLNLNGPGSLFDALGGPALKIVFADNLCTIPCSISEDLDIQKNVTIVGPQTYQLALGGQLIVGGVTVALSNLTIANRGGSSQGGGVYNAGALTLTNSAVTGNVANFGGGIFNTGTLTLDRSSVTGNRAFVQGGGVWNQGTLTLIRTTVTGNQANAGGGGIYNNGSLTLMKQSSVCGNQGGDIVGSFNGTNTCP